MNDHSIRAERVSTRFSADECDSVESTVGRLVGYRLDRTDRTSSTLNNVESKFTNRTVRFIISELFMSHN